MDKRQHGHGGSGKYCHPFFRKYFKAGELPSRPTKRGYAENSGAKQEEFHVIVGQIIDFFASGYGWSVEQIKDLTEEEISILSDAALKRNEAMYGTSKKGKIKHTGAKKKFDDDVFSKFAKYKQLEEVGD